MQRIAFLDKGVVDLLEADSPSPKPGELKLKARTSLISTGTEGITFMRLFAPGTHWDQWVKYPHFTGYCMVGEVTEVGEGVEGVGIGDRVVARVTHASEACISAAHTLTVPDGVSDEEAAWFALAMVAFMGAKAGEFGLGDEILIVGGGPVGQMATRWAVAAGAEKVVVMDTVPMRLELARAGGATGTILARSDEAKAEVEEAFGGQLPPKVMDTTGIPAVFESCLALTRSHGTMILLGDVGDPSQQRLTPDVVIRGVKVRGAHISHETERWTEKAVLSFWMDLVRRGRFRVDGLTTHRFVPAQCKEAFDLIMNRRAETMGVVFGWGAK